MSTLWLQYRKLQVMFKVSPADCWSHGVTRLALTASVIRNPNYVIMVTETVENIFVCYLYCNHQVHRDFFITLYHLELLYLKCNVIKCTC
jgi:hypothetical protein